MENRTSQPALPLHEWLAVAAILFLLTACILSVWLSESPETLLPTPDPQTAASNVH